MEKFPSQAEAEPNSFEEQFSHPEQIEINGDKIQVHSAEPAEPKSEVPTMFGLGWSAIPEVYKDNMELFVEHGRKVISPNAPHGVEAEPVEGYPNSEIRKVEAILGTLDAKQIEKVDVVAHSESGYYMLIAAALHPERFRNMVLVDPAGIIGKDNLIRLAKGFLSDIAKQVALEAKKPKKEESKPGKGGPKEILGAIKILGRKPIESLKQVVAMAGADSRELLAYLKEQGIGISIIHGVDDQAFPIERITNAEGTGTLKDGRKYVDGFYSVQGSHNQFILGDPRYSALAEQALTDLENKQAKATQ